MHDSGRRNVILRWGVMTYSSSYSFCANMRARFADNWVMHMLVVKCVLLQGFNTRRVSYP